MERCEYMKLLIQNGHVIDPDTGKDGIYDVLVAEGRILRVDRHIDEEADRTVNAEGLYVMPGIIDLHVHLRDPGLEYKETLHTGAMAAAQLLHDQVLGRENDWADVFDPSRSILKPQLLVNGWEAVTNLLTPTKKRCPHLGCALHWNEAERTWDCACHGSRFSQQGKVLDNPANGDLQ